MKTLKDLTEQECINIATIAEPNVEWKLIQCVRPWSGFDLIEKNCQDWHNAKHIFQIDYTSNNNTLNALYRFRLYNNLYLYPVDNNKILDYLSSIQCMPF